MILLAIDTTAIACSCAIMKDEELLCELQSTSSQTHSEQLLPMIEHALKLSQINTFDAIDAYAVTVGPGSFTGVRIGVATIKGLAFGKNKPCISVSTLDALAENGFGLEGLLIPVMDARRQQVYTALYRSSGKEIEKLTQDSALSLDELFALIQQEQKENEPLYFIGDGYALLQESAMIKNLKNVKVTPPLLRLETAASVGQVARKAYLQGKTITDLELAPVYLRASQAERERNTKLKEGPSNGQT